MSAQLSHCKPEKIELTPREVGLNWTAAGSKAEEEEGGLGGGCGRGPVLTYLWPLLRIYDNKKYSHDFLNLHWK